MFYDIRVGYFFPNSLANMPRLAVFVFAAAFVLSDSAFLAVAELALREEFAALPTAAALDVFSVIGFALWAALPGAGGFAAELADLFCMAGFAVSATFLAEDDGLEEASFLATAAAASRFALGLTDEFALGAEGAEAARRLSLGLYSPLMS